MELMDHYIMICIFKVHTIVKTMAHNLMIPYGRGGAGFSVLDVTDPDAPLHLYSVLNDTTKQSTYNGS